MGLSIEMFVSCFLLIKKIFFYCSAGFCPWPHFILFALFASFTSFFKRFLKDFFFTAVNTFPQRVVNITKNCEEYIVPPIYKKL